MTAPRLEACYFPRPGSNMWDRLSRVLRYTAETHCPSWQVRVRDIPAAAGSIYSVNTAKMEYWAQVIAESADGDRVLLIDADTMILRPLDPVWDRQFDVAYTTKTHRFPLNAGVVFLRISERTKAFMAAWADENRIMFKDRSYHQRWRATYGGINQASLGRILADQHATPTLGIETLPCLEWNCEDSAWAQFDPAVTRIVHVKSALRIEALMPALPVAARAELVQRWRALDREAALAERRTA